MYEDYEIRKWGECVEAEQLRSEVEQAARRIEGYVRQTPLEPSVRFSAASGSEVFFKLENLQHTGSFKVRGAANKLLSLSPGRLSAGVFAASSGNHGLAVARTADLLGAPCTVFVPEDASQTKVEAIREYGAEVVYGGDDAAVTEDRARRTALREGTSYVSPYNDPEVVAGQGTIAAEMLSQVENSGYPSPEAVFVPVGGAGMISGVAAYLKAAMGKEVKIYGCQPENSAVMYESVNAGRILDLASRPTLSDGTAGGVEPGAITFDLCREYVDEWVLVTEDEIKQAIKYFMDAHHMMIEGAAGVSIAALLKSGTGLQGATAAAVVCGANISLDTLGRVLR